MPIEPPATEDWGLPMGPDTLLHVTAGTIGLAAGYIALAVRKGGQVHRVAGRCFGAAMLAGALTGMWLAVARGVRPDVNVPAALLASALVLSGVAAVRTSPAWRRVRHVAFGLSLGAAVSASWFLVDALRAGGARDGMPWSAYALSSLLGGCAVVGDLRWVTSDPEGGLVLKRRHLWRMMSALFLGALSVFIGQARVFPQTVRDSGLLPLPVLSVIVVLVYWLWRTRRPSGTLGGTGLSHHEGGAG